MIVVTYWIDLDPLSHYKSSFPFSLSLPLSPFLSPSPQVISIPCPASIQTRPRGRWHILEDLHLQAQWHINSTWPFMTQVLVHVTPAHVGCHNLTFILEDSESVMMLDSISPSALTICLLRWRCRHSNVLEPSLGNSIKPLEVEPYILCCSFSKSKTKCDSF